MNKQDKELLEVYIKNEKQVIKDIKSVYNQAYNDIDAKIQELQRQIDLLQETGETDEVTKSLIQSKVYQKQYQQVIKDQIDTILDNMNSNNYDTINSYLQKSYEDGYIGTIYNIQSQGVPLIMPIDQGLVIKAIQTDSKLSKPLYESLGINTNDLKKTIRSELSRGVAQGYSYNDIARNINNVMNVGANKSIRIARTEGHRINQQSTMDVMGKAKEKGADVVKQWDATMDRKTRSSHQRVDGEIRELDETFSNGLRFPGDPRGPAAEVINCRCVLLQRARWALDDETGNTKWDNKNGKLITIDSKNYQDFKNKYFEEIERNKEDEKEFTKYSKLLGKNAPSSIDEFMEIKYNETAYDAFKEYANSIKTGELTPLADFELYQKVSENIDSSVIGTVTSNGIEIKEKSNHFIARVIGSISQKRSGIEISNVVDTLISPDRLDDIQTNINGRSQRFMKNGIAVTVNPDTGMLIQTNPIKKKKKGE